MRAGLLVLIEVAFLAMDGGLERDLRCVAKQWRKVWQEAGLTIAASRSACFTLRGMVSS
jgi:hypothetical protein